MGLPKGRSHLQPQHQVLRKNSQLVGWLPEALLLTAPSAAAPRRGGREGSVPVEKSPGSIVLGTPAGAMDSPLTEAFVFLGDTGEKRT